MYFMNKPKSYRYPDPLLQVPGNLAISASGSSQKWIKVVLKTLIHVYNLDTRLLALEIAEPVILREKKLGSDAVTS